MVEKSLLEEIQLRGVLRIPVDFSPPPDEGFPPEFYIDPKTKKEWGIAPIFGGLMANDLEVKLECINMPWPQHITALLDGKVDLLPKHVNTPKRALQVEFANGRFMLYRVTALIQEKIWIYNKEELNQVGKIISVWYGSSIKDIIKKEFPLATMKEFKFPWIEVIEGRADACLTDSVTKVFLKKNPEIKLMRDKDENLIIFSREYAQHAIKPGDKRFLNWINNWYQYHDAQGTINYWCDTWWESFMADKS